MPRLLVVPVGILLLIVSALAAASAQDPMDPFCPDPGPAGPTAKALEGDGRTHIVLIILSDRVPGHLCNYDGDGRLLEVYGGVFFGPSTIHLSWDRALDNYSAMFHQPEYLLPARGSVVDAIDLTACKDGIGTIVLSLHYEFPFSAGFGSESGCGDPDNMTDPKTGSSGPKEPSSGPQKQSPTDAADPETALLQGTTAGPMSVQQVQALLVAVAGLTLAVLWWKFAAALQFMAAGLLGRRLPGHATDHPHRARILDLIEQEPGIYAAEVARRLDLANGQTIHHLGILTNRGHLESCVMGGHRRFFPARSLDAAEKQAIAELRRPHAVDVYRTIAARPGARLADVADSLGLDVSSVSRIARRLQKAGALDRQAGNRLRALVLPQRVDGALGSRA